MNEEKPKYPPFEGAMKRVFKTICDMNMNEENPEQWALIERVARERKDQLLDRDSVLGIGGLSYK